MSKWEQSSILSREQWSLGAAVAMFTWLAWHVTLSQEKFMCRSMPGMGNSSENFHAWLFSFGVFLFSWAVMMVAMMLPSAAPMIFLFDRLVKKRKARGEAYAPTAIFACGYFLAWTASGIAGYFALLLGGKLTDAGNAYYENFSRAGAGIIFIAAGLYQLTPLKTACLRHCQSPLAFLAQHFHEGAAGALRTGMRHGLYCLGCCWALMLVWLAAGMMNLTAMLLLALVILIEKFSARIPAMAYGVGFFLMLTGTGIVFF